MKRSYVIVIPLFLLILLNACNMGSLPQYSNEQWTAIAKTQQVMARPESDRIKSWLNAVPTDHDKFVELEQVLIGKYEVTGVGFPTDYYFEVNMNCECVSGSACCDPERMFLITLLRMERFKNEILAVMPETVQYMDVVCFDHKRPFYAMYAPWDMIKKFLTGVATAADLKASITPREMR